MPVDVRHPAAPRSAPIRRSARPARAHRACAAALAAALLAGCDENDGRELPTLGGTGTARLRLVHAIPDAPPVDLRVDAAAPVVTGLAFRQATPAYLALSPGDRRLRVASAGAQTPAVDVTATFAAGTATTVVATGLAATSTTEALVLADTLSAPPGGQVRLRVVHAAPTVGLVDLYLSAPDAPLPATPSVTGLAFRSAASSLTLPAGSYRVRLTPNGLRTTTSVDVTPPALAAGTVAKAIVMDPTGSGSTAVPATVVVVIDRAP